ncbi:integrin alpha-X isoform X1 [Esox lucius]|uniref:VWFA domain-containing protein n=1 Tax=Esox lucius TaxID=8010 RepID=A0A3P8ZPA5_ESOLU|nr:integrin alpha-X isoform X1 [Esox lucius]
MDKQMCCLLPAILGLWQFVTLALGFSFDIRYPKTFSTSTEAGSHFGHRVCHFGPTQGYNTSILVTAPLQDNGTGVVYRCSYHSTTCEALPIHVDSGVSFGLSLACNTDRAMMCGPRQMFACDTLNYLQGICVELGPQLSVTQTLKPAFQECRDFGLDAVILFDGSQSIVRNDFETMINFIKDIIRMFTDPRAQIAVAQYSTETQAIFHFQDFLADRNPDNLMVSVDHFQGQTYTPSAIRYVLEKMMTEAQGMKKYSRKLLVVITDGKSNDKTETFDNVIPLAETMGVTRFAIGVGNKYSSQELEQIASSPNFVFEANSFDALKSIQNELSEKIFAIEGSNSTNSSSFEHELSQGGFSTTLSGALSLFGVVGSYSWSGGVVEVVRGANATFINASALEKDMKDSYLGYSVAVAETGNGSVYFAGAPRYNHTGLVLVFQRDPVQQKWTVAHKIPGTQLGSYFGAQLCVLEANVQPGDSQTGLLLIGAPWYHAQGVGGEVHVCTLETWAPNCSLTLHGAHGNTHGQFGASLTPCPDLNQDGLLDLAVGAPAEDRGQGAVYIFLGCPGGVQAKYSQRIQGERGGGRGLQFFGVSVHSAGDLNSDGLADLVVGAKGAAVILRSQPLMRVEVSVTVAPPTIPQMFFHCAAHIALNTPIATATLCVTVNGAHVGKISTSLQASISITVDFRKDQNGTRPARLLFYPRLHSSKWEERVTGTACYNISLSVPECISDYREVPMSVRLAAEGLEVPGTDGLKSVLSPDNPTFFTHMILLEKVCGEDHICISDLSVNITCPEVVHSPGFPVEVFVNVDNRGEDASKVELTLVHPSTISFVFAKWSFGTRQVAVWCVSNTTGLENLTRTVCPLSSLVLRKGAHVTVWVSFRVSENSSLSERLVINASVNTDNEEQGTLHDNLASSSIQVKLPVNIIIKGGDSSQYITFPNDNLLEHIYMVLNIGEVAAPVNVTFVIPVELDSGFLWNVSLPQIDNSGGKCDRKEVFSKKDNGTLFEQQCRGVICHLIGCTIGLSTSSQPTIIRFFGNISRKTEFSRVQVELASWGSLSFNQTIYAEYPAIGFQSVTILSILETAPESSAALIATLSVGFSLLTLAVVSWVLYKKGFFKSKEMPNDGVMDSAAPDDKLSLTADSTSQRETTL